MDQGDNDEGRVAGSFVINCKLTDDKTMTFSQYVLASDTLESINARLDIAAMVVERQRTFASIGSLEEKLLQMENQREHFLDIIADMKGREKLASNDRLALQNHQQNIKKYDRDIANMRARILEVKAEMGQASKPKLVA